MDLNLRTTTIGAQVSFLDSQKVRYIRGAVTISEAVVPPNPITGIKALPAGTVIGRNGAGLYEPYIPGAAAVPGTASTVTLKASAGGLRDDIVITAIKPGVAGDEIKVQLVDPDAANATLKVVVETDTIKVYVATDGTKAITSTIAQVIQAINAALFVKDIVVANPAAGTTDTDVVIAVAATPLAGGVDPIPAGAPNVVPSAILADHVTFTDYSPSGGVVHANQVVRAIDQARVIEARLPAPIDAYTKACLTGITWV